MKEKFQKLSSKLTIATGAALVAIPTFAEETGAASGSVTMIDTAAIDFSPLLTTIAAVIGVALVPMITVAAGKKGLQFVKSMINKIG